VLSQRVQNLGRVIDYRDRIPVGAQEVLKVFANILVVVDHQDVQWRPLLGLFRSIGQLFAPEANHHHHAL
jgi:hypothetical protein